MNKVSVKQSVQAMMKTEPLQGRKTTQWRVNTTKRLQSENKIRCGYKVIKVVRTDQDCQDFG